MNLDCVADIGAGTATQMTGDTHTVVSGEAIQTGTTTQTVSIHAPARGRLALHLFFT